MRSRIKTIAAAFLISIAGLQESCTKEKKEEIAYNLASSYINHGSWKMTQLEENGKDKTSLYEGYVFKFNTDGTVTATKRDNVIKGTWSVSPDGSKTKMNINFGSAPFSEMNEDWIIKNANANSIQLQHANGGDNGVDYLNFDKI